MGAKKPQISLPGFDWKSQKAFGGNISGAKGNPREARAVVTKRPMHLILKSKFHGADKSLVRRGFEIKELCNDLGQKTFVKVSDSAIAHDHIHLIIQPKSVRAYRSFIRALSGLIARKILGAEKGRASEIKSFWEARPFTRIVEWGKDLLGLRRYLVKNRLDLLYAKRKDPKLDIDKILARMGNTGLEAIGFAPI